MISYFNKNIKVVELFYISIGENIQVSSLITKKTNCILIMQDKLIKVVIIETYLYSNDNKPEESLV